MGQYMYISSYYQFEQPSNNPVLLIINNVSQIMNECVIRTIGDYIADNRRLERYHTGQLTKRNNDQHRHNDAILELAYDDAVILYPQYRCVIIRI